MAPPGKNKAVRDAKDRRNRKRRRAEIAVFAKEHSGTDLDLDRDLEAAGIEVVSSI